MDVANVQLSDGVGVAPLAVKSSVAANLIGVTTQTLANWRSEGRGPSYVPLGPTRVVYKIDDLDAWLDAHRVGGGR